jgi:hypothetical protein
MNASSVSKVLRVVETTMLIFMSAVIPIVGLFALITPVNVV